MRAAKIYQQGAFAGTLEDLDQNHYRFVYEPDYRGAPISLTMPVRDAPYDFDRFPPFFEGLLPEGVLLEAFLRQHNVDKNDMFQQLLIAGKNVVGSTTISQDK